MNTHEYRRTSPNAAKRRKKKKETRVCVSWLDRNRFHYTNVYQMIRDKRLAHDAR